MLFHSDIVYSADGIGELYSEIAVKFHGAIMGLIPTEYAEELHQNKIQPFSLFCMDAAEKNLVMLRFSSLDEKSGIISEMLEKKKEITIYGLRKPLLQVGFQRSEVISAQSLYSSEIPKGYRINILTPAIFRRAGKSLCSPDISRYLNSVIKKINELENLSIDEETLLNYVKSISLNNYSLSGQSYNVSGSVYKGMTGWADIVFSERTTENAKQLNLVLKYMEYSGIGAKTAVGMGGVSLEVL